MEKAQREWEKKFKENNSSTPDSCDPGNHSDITEERYEVKAQAPHPAETVVSYAEEAKSEVRDVFFSKELSKTQSNGVLLPTSADMGGIKHQNSRSICASESAAQEFAFPLANGKQNEESLETYIHKFSHSLQHEPHSHGSPGNQSAHPSSSDAGSGFQKGNASGNRYDLYALVPHEPSDSLGGVLEALKDSLGGVLEALKQARVSLQNKFNQVPLIEGRSVIKAIEPSVLATNPVDRICQKRP